MTRIRLESLGQSARRFALPAAVDRRALRDQLAALPHVVDAIVTETHAAYRFLGSEPDVDPESICASCPEAAAATPREHVILVRYGGADLDAVAARAGMTASAWCEAHAAITHTLSFVGFMPGFLYLRGLPATLDAPRLAIPRTQVPGGSLAIAGGFTGIYPFACPGGWNVVGHAVDHQPFEGERLRYEVGDRIRLREVSA